jgi:hypothetical protein
MTVIDVHTVNAPVRGHRSASAVLYTIHIHTPVTQIEDRPLYVVKYFIIEEPEVIHNTVPATVQLLPLANIHGRCIHNRHRTSERIRESVGRWSWRISVRCQIPLVFSPR